MIVLTKNNFANFSYELAARKRFKNIINEILFSRQQILAEFDEALVKWSNRLSSSSEKWDLAEKITFAADLNDSELLKLYKKFRKEWK